MITVPNALTDAHTPGDGGMITIIVTITTTATAAAATTTTTTTVPFNGRS